MEFALSVAVLIVGVLFAAVYARAPKAEESAAIRALVADRPWRKLGAAIALILAVTFFLGINFLSDTTSPRSYVLFWLVVMFLVAWLCILAIKDLLHTRKVLNKLANRMADLDSPEVIRPRKEEDDEQ